MVASKTALLWFNSNVKIKYVFKERVLASYKFFAKFFKGLAVLSIHKRATFYLLEM